MPVGGIGFRCARRRRARCAHMKRCASDRAHRRSDVRSDDRFRIERTVSTRGRNVLLLLLAGRVRTRMQAGFRLPSAISHEHDSRGPAARGASFVGSFILSDAAAWHAEGGGYAGDAGGSRIDAGHSCRRRQRGRRVESSSSRAGRKHCPAEFPRASGSASRAFRRASLIDSMASHAAAVRIESVINLVI